MVQYDNNSHFKGLQLSFSFRLTLFTLRKGRRLTVDEECSLRECLPPLLYFSAFMPKETTCLSLFISRP